MVRIMGQRDFDKEHKQRFYRDNDPLFSKSDARDGWQRPEGKQLIALARVHFNYSMSTSSVDIWRSIMRHYRRDWKLKKDATTSPSLPNTTSPLVPAKATDVRSKGPSFPPRGRNID